MLVCRTAILVRVPGSAAKAKKAQTGLWPTVPCLIQVQLHCIKAARNCLRSLLLESGDRSCLLAVHGTLHIEAMSVATLSTSLTYSVKPLTSPPTLEFQRASASRAVNELSRTSWLLVFCDAEWICNTLGSWGSQAIVAGKT